MTRTITKEEIDAAWKLLREEGRVDNAYVLLVALLDLDERLKRQENKIDFHNGLGLGGHGFV